MFVKKDNDFKIVNFKDSLWGIFGDNMITQPIPYNGQLITLDENLAFLYVHNEDLYEYLAPGTYSFEGEVPSDSFIYFLQKECVKGKVSFEDIKIFIKEENKEFYISGTGDFEWRISSGNIFYSYAKEVDWQKHTFPYLSNKIKEDISENLDMVFYNLESVDSIESLTTTNNKIGEELNKKLEGFLKEMLGIEIESFKVNGLSLKDSEKEDVSSEYLKDRNETIPEPAIVSLSQKKEPTSIKPENKNIESWICVCGTSNIGKFCTDCGKTRLVDFWVCEECKSKNAMKFKFCPECGFKKKEN